MDLKIFSLTRLDCQIRSPRSPAGQDLSIIIKKYNSVPFYFICYSIKNLIIHHFFFLLLFTNKLTLITMGASFFFCSTHPRTHAPPCKKSRNTRIQNTRKDLYIVYLSWESGIKEIYTSYVEILCIYIYIERERGRNS